MAKTIYQKVLFKNTTAKALYELYTNAKKHSESTASGPARITAKEGSSYSVGGGYITGKNLQLIKDKLIVQSWRASEWDEKDIDSTFIINFEPKGKDVVLHVTHANLPDKHADNIDKGWHTYYWNPWKAYLKGKHVAAAAM